MNTVLITGGGGYIGSHAVKRLLQEGCKAVVFDNFTRGYKDPLGSLSVYGDIEVIEGDLANYDDIKRAFQQHDIDGVFHFAALCLVSESMDDPETYFANNVGGTLNLLRVMNEHNVNRLIFSSTCAVYGNAQYLPIDEEHPCIPENPYGESKLMAERMIRWFGELHGLSYAILRYFNVCGADSEGEIGDSKKPSQLLVQNAVRGALGIDEFQLTCPSVNTKDGTPVRDYIDVEDLVEAHIQAYQYLVGGGESMILNLGNGTGWSVREIVDAVQKKLDVEFPVKEGEARKGEYTEVYADLSRARDFLNWKPKKKLEDSIKSLKLWYTNKPDGYEQ